MNRNCFRALRILIWVILVLVILVLVVFPLITSRLVSLGQLPFDVSSLAYVEMTQTFVMRAFGVVWIFFLGSCFASFLNVVAWRIPRGRGINGSSHCPYCNVKLSFRNNIPIMGWLRNSGRCATCRLPISPRYLIVEIVLGTIFLAITSAELLAGGWNLPLWKVDHLRGFEYIILDPPDDLIQLTAYHLVLIGALFTFVLIRIDKFRIPISVYVTALIFGLVLPTIWPNMQLVSWQVGVDDLIELTRFSTNQWLTMLTGLIGGAICGGLMERVFQGDSIEGIVDQQASKVATINEYIAGFSLIGVFLGWQSALSVSVLFCLASLSGNRFSVSARIFVATLVHLLLWRWLTSWFFWPGPTAQWYVPALIILVLGGLAWARSNRSIRQFD